MNELNERIIKQIKIKKNKIKLKTKLNRIDVYGKTG